MTALDLLSRWPVETAAAGWITGNGLCERSATSAHPFDLASVTKPLFAYVILVAIEEGTLSLDQPLGPAGSTVRHLLSHASGLSPAGPDILAPVGQRRIYSNAGFELLGTALAESSGMPTEEYFAEAIVEPLGMSATRLSGSPAFGAVSTVDDLLLFASELMTPTLIAPATLATAVQPHFPEVAGVLPGFGQQDPNPWGLGFEIRGPKSPHWTAPSNSPSTFGHFGRSGTMIWLDPVAQCACVALADSDFGPWAASAWPELGEAVLAQTATHRTD